MDALRPVRRNNIAALGTSPMDAERPKVRYDAERRNESIRFLRKILNAE